MTCILDRVSWVLKTKSSGKALPELTKENWPQMVVESMPVNFIFAPELPFPNASDIGSLKRVKEAC